MSRFFQLKFFSHLLSFLLVFEMSVCQVWRRRSEILVHKYQEVGSGAVVRKVPAQTINDHAQRETKLLNLLDHTHV